MRTRKSRARILVGLLLVLGMTPDFSLAQDRGGPPDFTIDAQMRMEAIDGALAKLNESYVFPDVAKKMEEAVRDRLAKGEYDQVTSAKQLCDMLTAHLREVSKDRHLGMMYFRGELQRPPQQEELSAEDRQRRQRDARERQQRNGAQINHGFEKCERLQGNVGYLDFRVFADPELAGETAAYVL